MIYEQEHTAIRVIQFIEAFCMVPEGPLVGTPVVLADFQKKFIKDVYNPEVSVRHAYLSIARKNGKTALIAGLLLAHLVGPVAIQNSQIVSGAMSRDQASLVFKLAAKMVALSERLSDIIKVVPSSKILHGLTMGTEYRALSADGATAHGLSPALIILDEVGQVKGPTSPFIEALLTSQGAYENPLLIAISTSSPSDADMFSIWVDDAERTPDPKTVCHVYKADENTELMDEEQWAKANPALGIFRSYEDMRQQMEKADRLPSQESMVRNLLLNQRVSIESLWLAPSVWKSNNPKPELEHFQSGSPVAVGLDLSARNDLTAAVAATADEDGNVHLLPFVFTPRAGLRERALRDRAAYDVWVREQYMFAIGNKTIDYDDVALFLRMRFDELGIQITSVEFDMWRIDVFKKAAQEQGFAEDAEWNKVGQGYKDFSPRCENFLSLALDGKIRHGGHPLLTMAAANAIAVQDAAGNTKLDKSKSTQRIDPIIAAVMAVYPVSDGDDFQADISHWIS